MRSPPAMLNALLLAGALLLSGCEVTQENPAVVVRDSTGIQIFEVDRRQVTSQARFSTVPEWIIGDGAGPEAVVLHRVVDVDMSPEGMVWIANWGSQEIIGVDPATDRVVRLGGRGDGPGEFQGLSRVWSVAPGRVGAYDQTRRKYVEMAGTGALLRESNFPRIWEGSDVPGLYRIPAGDGGETFYLGVITGLPSGPVEGPYRGTGPLIRLHGTADTLTWLRGNTTFVGGGLAGGVLFGAATHLAEGPDGIWVGDSEEPEVVLWRDGHGPERIIRWGPPTGAPLTEARKEVFWNRLESALPQEEREMLAQTRDAVPFAEAIPEFGAVQASPEGSVWVGPFVEPEYALLDEPTPAQEWLVFHVDDHEASRVHVPEGLRLVRVGRDFALAVHTDALGIQTVRLHRLEVGEGAHPVDGAARDLYKFYTGADTDLAAGYGVAQGWIERDELPPKLLEKLESVIAFHAGE